jgi:hypothetical protein
MISLFSRDDYAALGLATVLDIERIPYRRIERLEQHDRTLLVALGGGLSAREADLLAGRRAVILNGGPLFAARMLGGRAMVDETAVTVPLTEPIWPGGLLGCGAEFGATALCLPCAPLCRVVERRHGELVAWLLADDDETSLPAVLRVGDCLWSAIDLGTAFAHLLTERYLSGGGRRPIFAPPAWARRVGECLYYAAPARLRDAVQTSTYRRLERRRRALGARASAYPIDPTGWLLIELVRALLVRAAGGLVRIARWPAGKTAAAVLTHDLEPRRYAYTDGLERLLARLAEQPRASAFGVVAQAAAATSPVRRARRSRTPRSTATASAIAASRCGGGGDWRGACAGRGPSSNGISGVRCAAIAARASSARPTWTGRSTRPASRTTPRVPTSTARI